MGRKYDIVQRIKEGNKRPIVTIDEAHEYKINVTRPAVLQIMALSEDAGEENQENVDQFEIFDKIITVALGKEALDYINSLDLNMEVYGTITNVIMAGIQGISLEEMEAEAQKRESFQKTK